MTNTLKKKLKQKSQNTLENKKSGTVFDRYNTALSRRMNFTNVLEMKFRVTSTSFPKGRKKLCH